MGSVLTKGMLLIEDNVSFLPTIISNTAFIAGSSKQGNAFLALVASN